MRGRRSVVLCAVACAASCGSELDQPAEEDAPPEIPPIVWSGEHLDYAPQPHAQPHCAGTLPYMDRYLDLGAADLGVDLGRRLYVQGSDEDPPLCPDGSGCLYADGIVYARYAPHEHELVHAVRSELGRALPLFEEGAAEMFGGDDGRDREPAVGDLREGLAAGWGGEPLASGWYTRGGLFSAYLHRHHGPQVTRALLEDTTVWTTADEAVALLETLTSMPFDELIDDLESQEPATCSHPRHYRYPLFPCNAPEAVRPRCNGGNAVPIEVSLECGDPSTIGPREGELFAYVAIDIPADGTYRFIEEPRPGSDEAWIEIKECALGCSSRYVKAAYGTPYDPLGDASLEDELFLRAGRYSLRFARFDAQGAATSLSVRITGDDCQ